MEVETNEIGNFFILFTGEETREDDRGKAERLHYKHGSEIGSNTLQSMKEMFTDGLVVIPSLIITRRLVRRTCIMLSSF